MRIRVIRTLLVSTIVCMVGIAASPAYATFPGQNGKIAFVRDIPFSIHAINPDGTGEQELVAPFSSTPAWSPSGTQLAMTRPSEDGSNDEIYVSNADGSGLHNASNHPSGDSDPAWSPDGTRFVFVSARTGAALLWVMNAGGSGQTLLGHGETPEWSPDGSRIVLRDVTGGWHLETIRPDGSGRTSITPAANVDSKPSWSPDGRSIVFVRYVHDPACPRFCDQSDSAEIWTVQADGSDPRRLTSAAPGRYDDDPEWSPDGSRIAFLRGGVSGTGSDIHVMNADGTGVVEVTTDNEPKRSLDWQPIPSAQPGGYPRPKGATPTRVSLVPAYYPCTSASANRTHGPALERPSCNPPVPNSNFATVGTPDANSHPAGFEGWVRYSLCTGACGVYLADVFLEASITDVRAATGQSDYTGELLARVTLRITDKVSDQPGAEGQTMQDVPFRFEILCGPTGGPADIGSTCSTRTTANAIIPNSVNNGGTRAIWELGQVEVFDGGPDGESLTPEGNTVFARQGLFIP